MQKNKILILSRGTLGTFKDNIAVDKSALFAKDFTGDIVHVVHNKINKSYQMGSMNFVGCYYPIKLMDFKLLLNIYFIFWVVFLVAKKRGSQRYDIIIAREPLAAGIIALLVSKIFGIPYVVEFNGNYLSSFLWDSHSWIAKVKKSIVRNVVPIVIKRSAAIKLLYPTQIDNYGVRGVTEKVHVFHDFVPVSKFKPTGISKPYVALLGGPLYLKGADILIEAFKLISQKHSDIELKIIGWSLPGERESMLKLCENYKNINIYPSITYGDSQKIISESLFIVLPSRTEAMGRVLLEAMAFGKAIIGSDVDGIPHYLVNDTVGYIFKSEDVNQLSMRIDRLLTDTQLMKKFSSNARELVMREYSEDAYYKRYKEMLLKLVAGHK